MEVTGCRVERIPTRGFLITTRRKVLVENNEFHRTHLSGILVENDAKGWFESGYVRHMTIRGNRFIECGEPVVYINPQNTVSNQAVHQNVRIEENEFLLDGLSAVSARSTDGLRITGNTFHSKSALSEVKTIKTVDCADVEITDNHHLPLRSL